MEAFDKYTNGEYCKFFGAYAKVYTLADEKGNVFYVGCTVRSIETRIAQHISEARATDRYTNKKKAQVIKSLDFKMIIKVVDMMWVTARKPSETTVKTRDLENKWIIKFHELGYDLCNRRAIKSLYPKKPSNTEFVGQTFVTSQNKQKDVEILESQAVERAK